MFGLWLSERWNRGPFSSSKQALFFSCLVWVAKQLVDGEMNLLWNPLFLPMAAFGILVLAQIVLGATLIGTTVFPRPCCTARMALLCFLATQTLIRSSQARKLA